MRRLLLRPNGGGLGLLGPGFGRSNGMLVCDVGVCDVDWEGAKWTGRVCLCEREGGGEGESQKSKRKGREVHLLNHRLERLLFQKHCPRASTL